MAEIARRLPEEESNRLEIESAPNRADAMLMDSREQLVGLRRTWEQGRSLKAASTEMAQGPRAHPEPSFKIHEGLSGNELRQETCEALHCICTGAVYNASRHSSAAFREVELADGVKAFALHICDHGKGFDTNELLKQGQHGRFDLPSVKEWAARIGATLAISSTWGSGPQNHVSRSGR